jgi:hypothetical protein
MKTPNSKTQKPNKIPKSKLQNSDQELTGVFVGIWNLKFIWSLGFGIWSLLFIQSLELGAFFE